MQPCPFLVERFPRSPLNFFPRHGLDFTGVNLSDATTQLLSPGRMKRRHLFRTQR
jgi:hypothetical protein